MKKTFTPVKVHDYSMVIDIQDKKYQNEILTSSWL